MKSTSAVEYNCGTAASAGAGADVLTLSFSYVSLYLQPLQMTCVKLETCSTSTLIFLIFGPVCSTRRVIFDLHDIIRQSNRDSNAQTASFRIRCNHLSPNDGQGFRAARFRVNHSEPRITTHTKTYGWLLSALSRTLGGTTLIKHDRRPLVELKIRPPDYNRNRSQFKICWSYDASRVLSAFLLLVSFSL